MWCGGWLTLGDHPLPLHNWCVWWVQAGLARTHQILTLAATAVLPAACVPLHVSAAAHGCFSSMTVSGPIATTVSDLMLMYAAMANTDYPAAPSDAAMNITSSSSSSRGLKTRQKSAAAECGVAAAAAVAAPPLQPLELPQELPGSGAEWRPLSGMRFGIYKEVSLAKHALGLYILSFSVPLLSVCVCSVPTFTRQLLP